jgi:hypothetical protein
MPFMTAKLAQVWRSAWNDRRGDLSSMAGSALFSHTTRSRLMLRGFRNGRQKSAQRACIEAASDLARHRSP